jgi:hypothetical protein
MNKVLLGALTVLALILIVVSIFAFKQEKNTGVQAFVSSGLGLSRQAWEKKHEKSGTGPDAFVGYDDGSYSILFNEGNTLHIERIFRNNKPQLDKAIDEGESLIPKDSRFINKYRMTSSGAKVYFYFSKSLRDRFKSDDIWTNAKPGNFTVLYDYDTDNGKVDRIIIGPGNNP